MEEFIDCDTQSIAEFLNCRYSSTVISAANDIVHGGLRNTANATEFINGNIAFLTQLNDSLPDSFAYGHRYHLFLSKMIPVCT